MANILGAVFGRVSSKGEAPISKHQIPNNIQIPISDNQKGVVWNFGHLVIGNYLGFGVWNLGFEVTKTNLVQVTLG